MTRNAAPTPLPSAKAITHLAMPGYPWNDELEREIVMLDEAVHTPRATLTELGEVPKQPGMYVLFYVTTDPVPCLACIADGTYFVYVGSAADLHERLNRHRLYCRDVPGLRGGEAVITLFLATPSHGSALFMESLFIQRHKPIWNRVMKGFGSKPPGPNRMKERVNPFNLVFPGRNVGTGPPRVTKKGIERRVNEHFVANPPPALWPAM